MSTPAPADSTRAFTAALGVALALLAVLGVILSSSLPSATREAVSSIGFIAGALAIMVSGSRAARRCRGRRRRAWFLLCAAAGTAFLGNAWTTLSGGDPVQDTSVVGDSLVAIALVLVVFGLLEFSDVPFRGARLFVNWLDGIITGCAVLITAIVLVFSRLVEWENLAERPNVLLFPAMDVAVVTVALLLILRNQGNRIFYSFVGFGFVLYAVGDMVFALQTAVGTFTVGTPLDLMWISAYVLLTVAAWHPAASSEPYEPPTVGDFDVQGTVLVFALFVVAAFVQALFPGGPLTETLAGIWVVLVLAVGTRQILLVADNQRLRGGLELRVREKTADLLRATRQIEVMLNSVGDGIYGVDLDGRITFVNPSAARALGYAPEQLLGRSAHEALHSAVGGADTDEPGHEPAHCYVRHAIAHGLVASAQEDTYRRQNGTAFPVEVTASPLIEEDRISGAVVAFRDVTQRREVDRMKDEFLSIVSHELRTPLTSIRGSLGMLGSGRFVELTPQAERMVSIALHSSERLARLINDILDVERIRSGKLPMHVQPCEVAGLVRTAAKEMGPLAESAGVRLAVGDTPGWVLADPDRIHQTLTNLVGNSIKFSPPGATVVLEAVEDDDQVTFVVADEGRGIPADKLVSVFEPFEQVDSSDAREKGGTGIGLAISRGIVERHGGRIWAESELGRGTRLHFTLPTSTAAVSAPEVELPHAK